MHWIYLLIAIVMEVAGTTSMKLSEGFSKPLPSVSIFIFYGFSFTFLTLALKILSLLLIIIGVAGLHASRESML